MNTLDIAQCGIDEMCAGLWNLTADQVNGARMVSFYLAELKQANEGGKLPIRARDEGYIPDEVCRKLREMDVLARRHGQRDSRLLVNMSLVDELVALPCVQNCVDAG